MKPTMLGAVLANILSVLTHGLGIFLYYALRITYRPRERLIAIGVFVAFVALVALLIWSL